MAISRDKRNLSTHPFIHQLKTMPITADDEELSEEDQEDIALALKEKNEGTWENLKAKTPTRSKK